jgi:hypothetical protein
MNLKRIWKITWISGVVLLLLLVVILLVSLRVVDKTPYFEAEYYAKTVNSLNEAFEKDSEIVGKFEAGFGVENITPKLGDTDNPVKGCFSNVPLAGFGDRKSSAVGVHDSIYVKAAALKVNNKLVVAISADILLISPYVADSVAFLLNREAGIKREQIVFGSTHTHSSIGAFLTGIIGEKFSGKFQPGIISFLSRRFASAALKAIADIKPASVGSVEIKVPELVRNRMNKDGGRLNDKFTCLSIEQTNGRKAIIGTFAAHPTTLGASNYEFSGDYPGYWQRKIEEEYADVAIFFAGTLGSHSYSGGVGEKFEKTRDIGEKLAGRLINNNQDILKTDSVTMAFFAIKVNKSPMQFRVANSLYLAPFISNKLIPENDSYYLQGLKLGNLIWISMPLELSGEIAIDLKNALKLAGYNSMFTSLNGNYFGYVTPSKYYYHDAYESFLMGWYGPSMGDYITDLLYKSADKLTGKRL